MNKIEIREAVSNDKEFISNLMEITLNPFYNDDHREKATKILNDHISNSNSNFGLFTTEQKIFVLLKDEQPIGLVDLVRKKQNTFKISPIIIIESERSKGYGTKLYNFIENYVLKLSGRQIYCTVSEDSTNTIKFFSKNNFTTVGKLQDYYKNGKLEYLMCKDFSYLKSNAIIEDFNIQLITDLSSSNVTNQLKIFFDNIIEFSDQSLIDKLSRNIGNKNDVYVAIKKENQIIGFSVLSKKKSGVVKILPIYYLENICFFRMVNFIEHQFKGTSYKKLYIQTFSLPSEVLYLQTNGWNLESLLPNSYKSNTLSLLWAKNI
jgi:ribosomal protein S18 acetylase RimI-like enzyme